MFRKMALAAAATAAAVPLLTVPAQAADAQAAAKCHTKWQGWVKMDVAKASVYKTYCQGASTFRIHGRLYDTLSDYRSAFLLAYVWKNNGDFAYKRHRKNAYGKGTSKKYNFTIKKKYKSATLFTRACNRTGCSTRSYPAFSVYD